MCLFFRGGFMNNPIRVAQIIEKMNNGGVESFIMNYYRNIDRNKVQFDFIVSEESSIPQRDEILQLGGRIYTIPSYKHVFNYEKALKKVFKENNYDIVHSQINTMGVFPLRVAKKCGIKIRISHSHSQANYKDFTKSLLKNVLKHFSKIYANVYFACSPDAAKYQFGVSTFKKGKVEIINNAIDTSIYRFNDKKRKELRKYYNILDNELVYVHVGRFDKAKNHEFLINVFKKINDRNKNTKLFLVGDGEEFNNIKNEVYRYGLNEKIIFVGAVNNAADYYQMADVLYLPSLYEGLGMALIEAQCCGLQCVASTNIPETSKISDLITFIDLKNTDEWVNYRIRNIDRTKYYNVLDCTNYNIATEAKKLENKYLELVSRGK